MFIIVNQKIEKKTIDKDDEEEIKKQRGRETQIKRERERDG